MPFNSNKELKKKQCVVVQTLCKGLHYKGTILHVLERYVSYKVELFNENQNSHLQITFVTAINVNVIYENRVVVSLN